MTWFLGPAITSEIQSATTSFHVKVWIFEEIKFNNLMCVLNGIWLIGYVFLPYVKKFNHIFQADLFLFHIHSDKLFLFIRLFGSFLFFRFFLINFRSFCHKFVLFSLFTPFWSFDSLKKSLSFFVGLGTFSQFHIFSCDNVFFRFLFIAASSLDIAFDPFFWSFKRF